MWTLAGEEATVTADLKVDGQFIVPDQGSIKVTLRDRAGVAIEDWNRKVLPDTENTVVEFVIPAALTFLETSEQLGAIYARVEWKFEGRPYNRSLVVRLAHFTPIQATEDGVRNHLGAGEHEVPNDAIDLYAAYYKLLPLYTDTLPVALRSTVAAACLAANNAIEVQAALVQLPALAAKLAQSETQESTSKTRMKLDTFKLEKDLLDLLDKELNDMETALSGIESYTPVTRFLVAVPTDVITG